MSLAVRHTKSSLVAPCFDSANDFGYDSSMKTLIQKTQAWYRRLEEKSLANMPPDARKDVLAFDAMWVKHKWRYLAIAAIVWGATAITMYFAFKTSLLEAVVLTLIVLGGLGLGLLSA